MTVSSLINVAVKIVCMGRMSEKGGSRILGVFSIEKAFRHDILGRIKGVVGYQRSVYRREHCTAYCETLFNAKLAEKLDMTNVNLFLRFSLTMFTQ